MNSHVKEKWITALRSNEYKQTQGFLHTSDGYCCLGVLCDLYAKEKDMEWEIEIDGNIQSFDGKTMVFPESVVDWSGIGNHTITTSHYAKLIDFNDNGEDFSFIADYIEENL